MSGRLLRLVCTAAVAAQAVLSAAAPAPAAPAPAAAPAPDAPAAAAPDPRPAGARASGAPTSPARTRDGRMPDGRARDGQTRDGQTRDGQTRDGRAPAPLPSGPAGPGSREAPTASGAGAARSDAPGRDAGGTAAAPARDRSVAALLTDLQRLYHEAERATEAYNAADEQLGRQRAEVARLDAELARTRLSLHDSRGAAGRLARQQYQSSSAISPYVRLLLARDPQHALDQGRVIGRLARGRAETVGRLTGTERRAERLAREARRALDRRLSLAGERRKRHEEVDRRLAEVERLLASLTARQLSAVAAAEKDGIDRAQREVMAAPGAPAASPESTPAGDRALRYAVQQVGKPYAWGAEGPRSYDCSGLTSQAWAAAGTPIPRTSQEQWARLPHVPLAGLRPGDLVVYHPEATHVALYLGEGMIVHAPRTGESVTVAPIASLPILGAVRPGAGPGSSPGAGSEAGPGVPGPSSG